MIRRAIPPLALLLSIALLVSITPLAADDEDGGPLVLMGIDAEDHWRASMNGTDTGQHGPIENYVMVVKSVLDKVTNERDDGLLVVGGGKSATDDVTTFWEHVAADLSEDVTFANGVGEINDANFENFELVIVVSDAINTPSGGLTDDENEALTQRQADVARFINRGGGLVGFSSDFTLSDPYGYIGGIGGFAVAADIEGGYSDIEPVNSGPELGITDDLDVCCWHDAFVKFPSFLEVLAIDMEATGLPAALGGTAVFVIPLKDTATGYMKLGGGQIAAAGVRHWFRLGCTPRSPSVLERLTVRWGNISFQLDDMLTATCLKDPSNSKGKGKGAFDTQIGSGIGRLSNAPGVYTAEWRFFDSGTHNRDTAVIIIRNPAGAVILNVSGALSQGDQQAFGKPNK